MQKDTVVLALIVTALCGSSGLYAVHKERHGSEISSHRAVVHKAAITKAYATGRLHGLKEGVAHCAQSAKKDVATLAKPAISHSWYQRFLSEAEDHYNRFVSGTESFYDRSIQDIKSAYHKTLEDTEHFYDKGKEDVKKAWRHFKDKL